MNFYKERIHQIVDLDQMRSLKKEYHSSIAMPENMPFAISNLITFVISFYLILSLII